MKKKKFFIEYVYTAECHTEIEAEDWDEALDMFETGDFEPEVDKEDYEVFEHEELPNDELPNKCDKCGKHFNNGDIDLLPDNTTICHECKYIA